MSVVTPVEAIFMAVPIAWVPEPMVIPFVRVLPPELVILKASLTAVLPVPVASAWSRRRRASVAVSL